MARKLKWEVTLAGADNGYIARIGCKLIVFEKKETLIEELTAYINGLKTTLSRDLERPTSIEDCPETAQTGLADSIARS